jgi:xanthine dehydrogenase molybdopterin-binding subunit B
MLSIAIHQPINHWSINQSINQSIYFQVLFYGQIIGCIVADTREIASSAVQLVRITYEDLEAVYTIDVLMIDGLIDWLIDDWLIG